MVCHAGWGREEDPFIQGGSAAGRWSTRNDGIGHGIDPSESGHKGCIAVNEMSITVQELLCQAAVADGERRTHMDRQCQVVDAWNRRCRDAHAWIAGAGMFTPNGEPCAKLSA